MKAKETILREDLVCSKRVINSELHSQREQRSSANFFLSAISRTSGYQILLKTFFFNLVLARHDFRCVFVLFRHG